MFTRVSVACIRRRVCLLVEGRGSRVTSRGSRVNSRGSSVNGRGSRVTSRGSKNSSQLFLNVVKSKFHIGLCLRSVGACLNELAEVLKAKIREVDTLLEQMRSQAKNKQSETYPVVLSDPLEIREEGKRNETDNKADKSRKRLERRKWKSKNVFKTTLSHASNISKTCHRETEIEKTKLPKNTNLASMDITSLKILFVSRKNLSTRGHF